MSFYQKRHASHDRTSEKSLSTLQFPQSISPPLWHSCCYVADSPRSKVRCPGERPSCSRCSRLCRSCTWSTSRQQDLSPPRLPLLQANCVSPLPAASESEYAGVGISTALLSTLVDLYFSNLYNASLLLHRQSFTRELSRGTAKKHIVLSVCALASRYSRLRSQRISG